MIKCLETYITNLDVRDLALISALSNDLSLAKDNIRAFESLDFPVT